MTMNLSEAKTEIKKAVNLFKALEKLGEVAATFDGLEAMERETNAKVKVLVKEVADLEAQKSGIAKELSSAKASADNMIDAAGKKAALIEAKAQEEADTILSAARIESGKLASMNKEEERKLEALTAQRHKAQAELDELNKANDAIKAKLKGLI